MIGTQLSSLAKMPANFVSIFLPTAYPQRDFPFFQVSSMTSRIVNVGTRGRSTTRFCLPLRRRRLKTSVKTFKQLEASGNYSHLNTYAGSCRLLRPIWSSSRPTFSSPARRRNFNMLFSPLSFRLESNQSLFSVARSCHTASPQQLI